MERRQAMEQRTFRKNSTSGLDFPQVFDLQYQFCYTHRQYFDSFGNFRVFSILIWQLYAYSRFWAWEIGSFIWVRFSSIHHNTAPYTQQVKQVNIHKAVGPDRLPGHVLKATGKCLQWHFQPLPDRICNNYIFQTDHPSRCAQER